MGIAALLIVCFHGRVQMGFALWDRLINVNGNIGVDFFVFLAGYGTAFSLKRNPDFYSFYMRRIKRILPSYYAAVFVLCFFMKIDRSTLFTAIIPIGVWMGHSNCWYISATMLYYLLVPLFYFSVLRARSPRLMLGILLIITGLVIPSAVIYHSIDIALMRIPALVIGVAFGIFQQIHTSKSERIIDLSVMALIFVIGALIFCNRGLLSGEMVSILTSGQEDRLWKNLMAPMCVTVLACILEGLEHTFLRLINRIMGGFGKYSLEIYLSHIVIMAACAKFFLYESNIILILMLTFAYPVARLLYFFGEKLLTVVRKLPVFKPAEIEE